MSDAPRLIANIGGEEAARGQEPRVVETVARLWHLLFERDSVRLQDDTRIERIGCEGLMEDPEGAAFPWLEGTGSIFAWLNTRAAAKEAAVIGGSLAGAQPEIVERVHDKAFALAYAETAGLIPDSLRGLSVSIEPDALLHADRIVAEIESHLGRWPSWTDGRFTLKPRIGGCGRGRVAGVQGRADTAELRGALSRLAKQGGAILEPWLQRSEDFSVQFHVSPGGELTLLGVLNQSVSDAGVFRGHFGSLDYRARVDSHSRFADALIGAGAELARGAHARGFHGPCGIDAFSFSGPNGIELRSAVEFNARFTMGTVLLGLVRRASARLGTWFDLSPGQSRPFHFALDAPCSGWPDSDPTLLVLPLWREDEAMRPALVVAQDQETLNARLGL